MTGEADANGLERANKLLERSDNPAYPEAHTNELVQLLDHGDSTVRATAVVGIQKIVRNDRDAVRPHAHRLLELLDDDFFRVRELIPGILSTLELEEAIPKLHKLLEDEEEEPVVHGAAKSALLELDPDYKYP